ncbi:MAG: hydrolase, haloacid dehalogenase-like family [Deltaproteobacteria bacterium]|nr:hydrolase, haloacid dehalogenase-like family [Deltaproteobacteria bacterium]
MTRNVTALIFDFDGTLTPLTIDFSSLRSEVESLAGKYAVEDVIKDLAHLYTVEMIYELERFLGEAGGEFRRMAFERMAELETEASRGKELYPYAREVLKDLKDRGFKIAIITRNCIGALKNVFPDMDEYVDSVVTRDDVARVKPHPEHVAAVLAALNATPDETVLVGDHPTDIAAGLAIGTQTIGVLTGRTQHADFQKAGAHYIADDIRDVKRFL